ncbi:hypothetical protein AB0I61_28400 [Polymorphospora rubra]|uniref:hypothetical protein n=1 Tax=Polymorphospora rubra TaxID=338584 RepID=UPI0033C8FEB6
MLLTRLAGVLVLTLGAAACVAESQVDYPHYESPAALFDRANLVIEADLSPDSRVTLLEPDPPTGTDPAANPQAGMESESEPAAGALVITVYTARVVTVFKGEVRVGQNIEVKEMGGTLRGVRHEVAGAVPLNGGERYVLFLSTYPNAPASLLNPQQGQYRVDDSGALSAVPGNELALTRADLERLAAGG